jgi:uncharacterized peroxidase-related enzyme
MPNIQVVQPEEATGELRKIYDELKRSRGQIAEVHKIQSLRPKSITKHMELYIEIMFSRSELSRAQREMMAVVVSAKNKCAYCVNHHGNALNKYWKNDEKVNQLADDFLSLNLSAIDQQLCKLAVALTADPSSDKCQNINRRLKKLELSDAAFLDATLVIAYFNFVNRIVLNHQIELEQDQGENYKY